TSVIGGLVYRGQRLSQLSGAYVFCDYTTGNFWAFRYDGSQVNDFQQLTAHAGMAGFGVDPTNGDILVADHDNGKIWRLDYQSTFTGTPLPATLADTGAFADLQNLNPNAGILPYDVNVPFWSDGARKQRWFSVPDVSQTIGFNAEGN